jgi:hypothetical protein
MATLVPALDALRSEFNRNFSRRDKSSDGWIGDAAHQNSNSDHNPDANGIVHAIDVDEDLRAPGATMRECVEHVVAEHRAGRDNRLTYVIYERTIWSASRDWQPRDYDGSNPHDKHAHFSAKKGANSRRSFGVEDLVKQEDLDKIFERIDLRFNQLKAEVNEVAKEAAYEVIRADADWGPGTYSVAGAVFDSKKSGDTNTRQLIELTDMTDRVESATADLKVQLAELASRIPAQLPPGPGTPDPA